MQIAGLGVGLDRKRLSSGRQPVCRLSGRGARKTDAGLVARTDLRMAEGPVIPTTQSMHGSNETIYRSCHSSARVLKKELMDHLRSKRAHAPLASCQRNGHSGGRSSMTSQFESDPREAEDRAIPGHWEGGSVAGGKNRYIADVGGAAFHGFLMLIKVPSKEGGWCWRR